MRRAMVVVGAGAGSRFGGDKLLTIVAGEPLVSHAVTAVRDHVDTVVLVCRADQRERVESLGLGVVVTEGGPTRTASETAGLAALEGRHDLIGIHDAARPLVGSELVERLFDVAARVGAAIPVVEPGGILVDRSSLTPVPDIFAAQTPQVFRARELLAAFHRASEDGFEGHDTADVVGRYSDLEMAAVDGDRLNIKITYPADIEMAKRRLLP